MTDPRPSSERDEQQGQEEWYEKTRYQVLVFAGSIALFVFVGGLILDWYIDPKTSGNKKDLVQALGLITAGVAGAVGIYFTWRGQRITQESLQVTQKNAEENVRLTEQGQITERFTRAIDQLGATDDDGNPRLELRLGGIYGLERIDTESQERTYHSTVLEVLTAYVRENAPWPPKSSISPDEGFVKPPGDSSSVSASDEAAEQDTEAEQGKEPARRTPSTDIQAILDILNRREEHRVPEKHRAHRLNLRETDLREASLRGAHLETAILESAHLEKAWLIEAHLEMASLSRAHLEEADLQQAHLEEAWLIEAHLEDANLMLAHLEEANLSHAHLEEAKLGGAHLEGAILIEAHLEGVRFNEVHLEGAVLSGAHLDGAKYLDPWRIRLTLGNERTELPEYLRGHRPAMWGNSLEQQTEIILDRLKQEPKATGITREDSSELRVVQFEGQPARIFSWAMPEEPTRAAVELGLEIGGTRIALYGYYKDDEFIEVDRTRLN